MARSVAFELVKLLVIGIFPSKISKIILDGSTGKLRADILNFVVFFHTYMEIFGMKRESV